MPQADLFINGKWQTGKGDTLVSTDPASAKELWHGNAASKTQVVEAIKAARNSLNSWRELSRDKRFAYLEKFTQLVTKNADELTALLATETGKPLWEAKTEITAMAGKLDASKVAYEDRCRELNKEMPGFTAITRHKPHGVVVILGPFNFPGHLPNGHIIPALLAGNTIVFKPSEFTIKFSIAMLKLWEEAGLPNGVINMVIGARDVGQALTNSNDIDGLFFTGSFATGNQIAKESIAFPKRILALEMGGNNPLVISKINDLQAAVYLTIQSAFTTAGQRCTCARRLIVVDNEVGREFVQLLIVAIKKIKVGACDAEPAPFMGPVISKNAADKVFAAYNALVAEGAKDLVPMQRLEASTGFITPGLIDTTKIKRNDDEIFGPLLQLIWADNLSAAIIEANNTSYGLSAGLISTDKAEYTEFMQNINSGIVTWNRPTVGSTSAAPFGGLGKSGNYRPSAYYAADYCAYPVASMETPDLSLPDKLQPGINI